MARLLIICLATSLTLLAASAPVVAQSSAGASSERRAEQRPRPRIVIQGSRTALGPNAKRQCRSWLAQEYRVSGTVIVPKMQCWWE